MDDAFTVLQDGVVYLDGATVEAVRDAALAPPPGFQGAAPIDSKGTIYPGLIELHNHLPYNVLRLGKFTTAYKNRDQWRAVASYQAEVTGPLAKLNEDPSLVAAIVRFVECKNLVAGVTTSQGITLATNAGIQSLFQGLVRNVEETKDKALPDASTHVSDLKPDEADAFAERLAKAKSGVLLHLAEGVDEKTRGMLKRLHRPNGAWAFGPALVGIHGIVLEDEDWARFGQAKASLVWSPASNLLLYGETAKVDLALKHQVNVCLGADWSFSGSKNLLAELKVARAVSEARGWGLDARALVAMVTRNPARALRWGKLGSLEAGKYADLVVLSGTSAPAYEQLIAADERDVALAMVAGEALYGTGSLLDALAPGVAREDVKIATKTRSLVVQTTGAGVTPVPLATAIQRLRDGLHHLPDLQAPPPSPHAAVAAAAPRIVFDDDLDALPVHGAVAAAAAVALTPKELDELTVAEDATYWGRFKVAGNLPTPIRELLPT